MAARVAPFGKSWESDGLIPRAVLREMGELGLFGIIYPPQYGGSGLDASATVVLAEAPGAPASAVLALRRWQLSNPVSRVRVPAADAMGEFNRVFYLSFGANAHTVLDARR